MPSSPGELVAFFLDKTALTSRGLIGLMSNWVEPSGNLGNQLTASGAKGTGIEYLFLYHSSAKSLSKEGLSSSFPIKLFTAFLEKAQKFF